MNTNQADQSDFVQFNNGRYNLATKKFESQINITPGTITSGYHHADQSDFVQFNNGRFNMITKKFEPQSNIIPGTITTGYDYIEYPDDSEEMKKAKKFLESFVSTQSDIEMMMAYIVSTMIYKNKPDN